jgi:hypothetical protein
MAIRALPGLCGGIVSERLETSFPLGHSPVRDYLKPRHARGFSLLSPPTLGERRHRGLARRRVAVRRHAVLMLPEGVGQHVQLASTSKCLAESNKSRVGAKATKYRPLRNLTC